MTQRMRAGLIEETRYPRNPLDVLAQQLVAMCAVDEWHVDELRAVVRQVANFADLSDDVFAAVLDLLSGRYPSDDFAELRPRLVWDRKLGDRPRARGSGRLAITNAGTIPDRGLYGVFLPDGTPRRGAGRGDGVREPARRGVRPGRQLVADRGHHARSRRGRRPRPASRARCRSGRATSPAARSSSAARLGAFTRELATARARATRSSGCATTSGSTSSRRRTWSSTLTISARRPAPSPTTARSSSNGSATSSATGASASCRRSGSGCTPRGAWRSRRASPSASAPARRCSGATTAS